jgi:hypothetical protein
MLGIGTGFIKNESELLKAGDIGTGFIKNESELLKAGDIAKVVETHEKVLIAEISTNGRFKCIDPESHKIVGIYSDRELEKEI